MKIYFKYLSILLKSQLQYRISFWMVTGGQFLVPFFIFAGMFFLFERFGSIKGWSFFEVALCFALIHLVYAVSECCARGFDGFASLVVNGDFDRLLVRPRSTVLQVFGSRFEFNRIGKLVESIVIFIWALLNLSIAWNVFKVLTLILMVIGGIFIFTGIFILTAMMAFWTIQGMELANILTDGGREMSQYPLGIYQKWVVRFFTAIIPFGCVNYFPLMYLLGKTKGNDLSYMLSPLWGICFIVPCLLLWRFGVKHYRSTGS